MHVRELALTVPLLLLQRVSGEVQLLQQPVPPEDWSATDIGMARRRVAALTEGRRLDVEMAAIAAEVVQRQGSCREAAGASTSATEASVSFSNGALNGSSTLAQTAAAALREEESVLESVTASNGKCSEEEGQREVLGSKAGALALLQYQRGLLSKYGMLTKVAQARGAAQASTGELRE